MTRSRAVELINQAASGSRPASVPLARPSRNAPGRRSAPVTPGARNNGWRGRALAPGAGSGKSAGIRQAGRAGTISMMDRRAGSAPIGETGRRALRMISALNGGRRAKTARMGNVRDPAAGLGGGSSAAPSLTITCPSRVNRARSRNRISPLRRAPVHVAPRLGERESARRSTARRWSGIECPGPRSLKGHLCCRPSDGSLVSGLGLSFIFHSRPFFLPHLRRISFVP